MERFVKKKNWFMAYLNLKNYLKKIEKKKLDKVSKKIFIKNLSKLVMQKKN